MSKSKVIITGGSGFLGKAVNKTLKDNLFYDVVSLGGKRDYDLTNQKQVDYLYKEHEPDIIVHLAAQAGVRYSIDNPAAFVDNNILGFYNILDASIKFKVKKLIETEDIQFPISDDEIVERLKKDGINVARRTVAKYRKVQNIPASFMRKRQSKLSGIL